MELLQFNDALNSFFRTKFFTNNFPSMNILLRLRGQADKNRICKVHNHSLSSTNNKDYRWLKHKVTIKISFRDVDKHACHITPGKNGNQKESTKLMKMITSSSIFSFWLAKVPCDGPTGSSLKRNNRPSICIHIF